MEICRVCLQEYDEIFLKNMLSDHLASTFTEVTSLEVLNNHNPIFQHICTSCEKQLFNAHAFRSLSIKSDKVLRDFVQKKPLNLREAIQENLKFDVETDEHEEIGPLEKSELKVDPPDGCIKQENPESESYDDLSPKISKSKRQTRTSKNIKATQKRVTSTSKTLKILKEACTVCGKHIKSNHLRRHKKRFDHFTDDERAKIHGKILKLETNIENEDANYVEELPDDSNGKDSDHGNEDDPKDHGESGKSVSSCNVCGRIFINKRGVRRHKLKEDHYSDSERERRSRWYLPANENGKFKCFHCPQELDSRKALHWHVLVHKERSIKCDYCDKMFQFHSQKRKHILVHHKESPILTQIVATCHLCGKMFNARNRLSSHINLAHSTKRFECTYCSRIFKVKECLNRHLRTHTGERPFQCDICLKRFNRQHILKKHKMVHTNERPYKCQFCTNDYRSRQHLKFHLKRVHNWVEIMHKDGDPLGQPDF